MIHRQLLSPQPFPPKKEPFPFPQQEERRRSQIRVLQQLLLPESEQPHPQFVAVKSLMRNPPEKIIIYKHIVSEREKRVNGS